MFALAYNERGLFVLGSSTFGHSYGHCDLPAGVVTSGVITNKEVFNQYLTQLLSTTQPHAIRDKDVIVALPEKRAFIQTLNLPSNLKAHEIEPTLLMRWKELIPILPEQVYYDYLLVNYSKEQQQKTYLVVAYPREVVDSIADALGTAHFRIKNFLPESFGVSQYFEKESTTQPVLLLRAISAQEIETYIVCKGAPLFSGSVHSVGAERVTPQQLDTIRQYFADNLSGLGELSQTFVLPDAEATATAEYMQAFQPAPQLAPAKLFPSLKPEPTQFTSDFIGLAGLIKAKSKIAILPDAAKVIHDTKHDRHIVTLTMLSIASVWVLIQYLSLSFLIFLAFITPKQTIYSTSLVNDITKQANELNAQVKPLNEAIAKASAIRQQRSKTAGVLKNVSDLATNSSGIQLTQIGMKATERKVQIDGTRTNKENLTAFVTKLKSQPYITKVDVPLGNYETEGSAGFHILLEVAL